jgi:pilus assembly protein Flp/PilA
VANVSRSVEAQKQADTLGDRYPWEEEIMGKALQLLNKLAKDEEGAALVEYTVLLGIMLVAVVGTIGLVGGWVNTKWAALWSALAAN